MIKVHSYGAGIQSVYLLHKYLRGEYERPDIVLFADTHAEPNAIYEIVNRDKLLCEKAGIRFEIVEHGDLSKDAGKSIMVPAYTLNFNRTKGQMRRQCTQRFKIAPMLKYLRGMGVRKAMMWIGISTDEATRMKDSPRKWITNFYPLIEMGISRDDCVKWLNENGITAQKSSCVFCPFRSADGWKQVLANKDDFEKAKKYDEMIRDKRRNLGFKIYVNSNRIPLENIDPKNESNLNLFENECEGYCGV